MSIVDHPVWDEIRPYWEIQSYERDATARSGPRFRLELRKLPRALSLRLRQLRQPCVACGREVQVLRQRRGCSGHDLYYSPSCPVAASAACSRGTEASVEYLRVRATLEGNPLPPTQDSLFTKRQPPPPNQGCQDKEVPPVPPVPPVPDVDDNTPEPELSRDCVVCRRPALCACQAPSRRVNEDCGRPMCESCATKVRISGQDWLLCPTHAAEHHQGTGPLWVKPIWMRG